MKKSSTCLRWRTRLQSLEQLDPRQARIVELRFFGGLSIEEAAHVLKISVTTVKREWTIAKAWFQRELSRNCAGKWCRAAAQDSGAGQAVQNPDR